MSAANLDDLGIGLRYSHERLARLDHSRVLGFDLLWDSKRRHLLRRSAPIPPLARGFPKRSGRPPLRPRYSSSSCLRMRRHSESLISACRGTGAALRVRGFAYRS
jgi:hypothetical protein